MNDLVHLLETGHDKGKRLQKEQGLPEYYYSGCFQKGTRCDQGNYHARKTADKSLVTCPECLKLMGK